MTCDNVLYSNHNCVTLYHEKDIVNMFEMGCVHIFVNNIIKIYLLLLFGEKRGWRRSTYFQRLETFFVYYVDSIFPEERKREYIMCKWKKKTFSEK